MTKGVEHGFGKFRRVGVPESDTYSGYNGTITRKDWNYSFPELPSDREYAYERHVRIVYFHGAPDYTITYSPYYWL